MRKFPRHRAWIKKSGSNTSGNKGHVKEESHTVDKALGWGVLSGQGKKDAETSLWLNCKILKSVHLISALQNGRFVLRPRITTRG